MFQPARHVFSMATCLQRYPIYRPSSRSYGVIAQGRWCHTTPFTTASPLRRRYTTRASVQGTQADLTKSENASTAHARFLANSSTGATWHDGKDNIGTSEPGSENDAASVSQGRGKLLPTTSHLFQLILPLGYLATPDSSKPSPPTVFLLHPAQPLTHVARLILASLAPTQTDITFSCASDAGSEPLQWSPSTDVGDFIRAAARASEFQIRVSPAPSTDNPTTEKNTSDDVSKDAVITVQVPTFAARTHFLRARLMRLRSELEKMNTLKHECDRAARRGARRMALGGFGMLLVYWGAVARLTFWDYGWDVMEPITYLSGLSTVIVGYLWFLYQGREVSYSSILSQSVSARQTALYRSRGLDVERWNDIQLEVRRLEREVEGIRRDYDGGVRGGAEDKAEDGEKKDKQKQEDGNEAEDRVGN